MKKLLLFLVIAINIAVAQAQTENLLWPIKGAKAGQNILYAPQSYIDDELNFADIYIQAKEGAEVISPVDGVISYISISYRPTLTSSNGWNCEVSSFDEMLKEVRKSKSVDKSKDPKYINGSIGIDCGNNTTIYISGLSGENQFKTGQAIKKGEPIGKVAYTYYKIKKPSISIAFSQNGKVADPMTPFGLKSTFVPFKEPEPVKFLTKQQAREDMTICLNAFQEAYPGLYDVVSKEEFESLRSQMINKIDSGTDEIDYYDFVVLISQITSKIHDSHISMNIPQWAYPARGSHTSAIYFGWINDTLICTNAVTQYKHLINRPIKSVNGMSADSMKNRIIKNISGYDAQVESLNAMALATTGFISLFILPNGGSNFDMNVEFADGEKVEIKAVEYKDAKYEYSFRNFMMVNRLQQGYLLKMIDDSTAYVGISTFSLNQVQTDDITRFIDSVSNVPNLIIDVRNNGGGNGDVLSKIYSHVAYEPFKTYGFSKVSKTGNFECFNNSSNYNGVDSKDMFSGYKAEKGKDGYYHRSEKGNVVSPAPEAKYRGKVYVLVNEHSVSAATLFPAMLVRNHRGVVVGRETRTAYHFMNAIKFAHMSLPTSQIKVTIPLIGTHFDTVVNDRVPYGRGVLPDYEVPLTMDEISFKNGDAILNKAMELIKNGHYFKSNTNPFNGVN